MTFEYRYFTVRERARKRTRKTVDYDVVSRRGDVLGAIEFYPHWRQHVLVPAPGSVWSAGCLQDVIDCIAKIREQRAAEIPGQASLLADTNSTDTKGGE